MFSSEILPRPRRFLNACCSLPLNESNMRWRLGNDPVVDKPRCVWFSARPSRDRVVGYPSGQRGQTVNLLAYAFACSNHAPTTIFSLFLAKPPANEPRWVWPPRGRPS